MSRLLGIAAVYILMFVAWTAAGLFLLLAPVRAGNLIHESFGLYPEVSAGDRGKKLVLRALGVGLLTFTARFAIRVAEIAAS